MKIGKGLIVILFVTAWWLFWPTVIITFCCLLTKRLVYGFHSVIPSAIIALGIATIISKWNATVAVSALQQVHGADGSERIWFYILGASHLIIHIVYTKIIWSTRLRTAKDIQKITSSKP